MSTVSTMDHKKPPRRISMSGFFTAHWAKKERKVAQVTRVEPKDVIIEEAAILTYASMRTLTPTVERARFVKDGFLSVTPKNDASRNASNNAKVSRKKPDSHKGGLFESFRSNKKQTKIRKRELKARASSESIPNLKCANPEPAPALSALARARNLSLYADESPQLDRLSNHSAPNRSTYIDRSSDEESDIRARKGTDFRRRHPKLKRATGSYLSSRPDVSDDDGISSGSHTPVSLVVTQYSMSDSDSCLQNDCGTSSVPDTPEDDDYFIPYSVIANATLPRNRKNIRNSTCEESRRSKSQESLLTTIVNEVTNKGGESTTECSQEASKFASSLALSMGSYPSIYVDETETDPNARTVRHNSMDKGLKKDTDVNFTTWEGREAVTLPRPRHRNIGNMDNLTENKETTRDFSWHAVKSKPKKGASGSNSTKTQNMMINKLPTTYGNSLPAPGQYYPQDRVHGLPVPRQSFQRPNTAYESGKLLDTTDGRYSKLSYRDEGDSSSIQSGSRTPPHFSQYSTVSGSIESIDEAVDLAELEHDPDLMLRNDEPEAWSVTVTKKLLEKMHKKNIKRQDNIFEFIQKERNFLTTLKIMQKIFAQGMMRELQYDQEAIVNKMFPQIDEFVEFTSNFVEMLDERQREETVICGIGDILVEQWSGDKGRQMLWLFGEFCSKQKEIVSMYKDMIKNDKKFQDFINKCGKNPLTRRRDIPGCILLVTQRVTKYPVILKTLIENSARKEHKSDTSNLNHALELVTDIIKKVDKQVLEYEKKMRVTEIYQKMDSKSYALYKDGRKFTRDDFYPSISKLLQVDTLQWRPNTVKRTIDVVLVLFKDVLVFLQESNQRYSFAAVGQPAAIPLQKLIVREKAGEDSVLFLLSASSDKPEMYELVFQTASHSKNWMQWIRAAVDACPEQDEGVYQDVEEKKLMEQKCFEAVRILTELQKKDKELNNLLQDKMKKFKMLTKIIDRPEVLVDMNYMYPTYMLEFDNAKPKKLPERTPVIQKAIEQVNRLSHLICGPGGLNRNPSSVGEYDSGSHLVSSLPKRSETFGGFDNGREPPSPRTKFATMGPKYLPKSDSRKDRSGDKKAVKTHSEGDIASALSDHKEDELPSSSCTQQGIILTPTPDQISALAQLTNLLNQFVSIATQQDTHLYSTSLKLMQQEAPPKKRNGDSFLAVEAQRNKAKHSEMEHDLTKREERLKAEKDQWTKEHKRMQQIMDVERQELQEQLERFQRDAAELAQSQEEIRRTKEDYQRQLARLRDQQRKLTQDQGLSHSASYPSSLTANKNNSNSTSSYCEDDGTDDNQSGTPFYSQGLGSMPSHLSKSHSSLEGELGETQSKESRLPTYAAGDYPRTFPGPGKREQSAVPQQSIQAPVPAGQAGAAKPIHLQFSAANQVVDHMITPKHGVIPNNLAKSKHGTHQVIPSKLKGLSGLQSSQNPKPTLKSKLLPHKKAPKSGNSSSELLDYKTRSSTFNVPSQMRHSKSEALMDMAGRYRSTSSPNPNVNLAPPETESGLERSNSASSNSSKEGKEKKKSKKRRSWETSDKPGEKQIYQV